MNRYFQLKPLTLPVLCISESCIEIKNNLNFYFHTSLCYPKGFMKALKAFIKRFEVARRSVKIKSLSYFFLFVRNWDVKG